MPEGDGDGAIFRTALVVAFASNDERTAKRISDSLGTATEMRAQANYAGHRLSHWLGHVMVSRRRRRVRC